MNICVVVSAVFPPREGMGFYVWNLSRYLINQGHQVQIITRGAAGRAFHEIVDGVAIWRPFFAPLYPFHVHLHSLFVSKLIRTLEADVDIFHSHSPLIPPVKTSRPVLLTFHSTVRHDIKATKLENWITMLMKLQAPVSYLLEVENLKTAAIVSAVSPRVAKALQTYPYCPSNVSVVWNGVDTHIFYPRADKRREDGFILTVGRLGPGKGLEDLIDAITLISEGKSAPELVIIGEGPHRNSLEKRVNASGIASKIRFEGHISDRNRLASFYRQASLFVLPSYHEGLPTVVLEAMACGCPVLATNVGGVPDIIEDGFSGLLVQPGNPRQLASAIQTMLANPQKLNQMGLQAYHTIEQRFSWQQIGSKFVDLYASLLPEGHR